MVIGKTGGVLNCILYTYLPYYLFVHIRYKCMRIIYSRIHLAVYTIQTSIEKTRDRGFLYTTEIRRLHIRLYGYKFSRKKKTSPNSIFFFYTSSMYTEKKHSFVQTIYSNLQKVLRFIIMPTIAFYTYPTYIYT